MSKIKTLFRWFPLAAASLIIAVFTHYYISLFVPPGSSTTPVVIEFEPGASFNRIAKVLKEKGIIRDINAFVLLARLRGSTKKARAGEYEFNVSMLPVRVLEKMEKGLVIKHPVTIPEGYNLREIADLLEREGLSKKELFIDKVFLSSMGVSSPSAEGFLFPDTYQFSKGMTEEAMIKIMVSRFMEVFTDKMESRGQEMGMSVKDVVTLASMVEKETGEASERPRIAGVFLNRIKMGIPLQSDPTVIYGIKGFNGNLTKKDLLTETPYNTYRKRGLPEGPIANPGVDSIKAVLYPEEGNYLYFVSKNDGTHHFSRTLLEHNRAVYKYQLKKQDSKSTTETRRR